MELRILIKLVKQKKIVSSLELVVINFTQNSNCIITVKSERLIWPLFYSFPNEFEFGMFLFLSLLSCRYRLSQTAWPQRASVMEFPGAAPSRRAGRLSPISETWESRCRRNMLLLLKLKVKRYNNIMGNNQLKIFPLS